MWNSATVMMIVEGTFATLYMTLVSTLMAYVIGLPAGVALVVTGREGLRPNKTVSRRWLKRLRWRAGAMK